MTVYRRDYVDANAPWELVGTTPLKDVRQPRGMFVWKIRETGFRYRSAGDKLLVWLVSAAPGRIPRAAVTLDEARENSARHGASLAAKYSKALFIPGYEGMPELDPPGLLDRRYEVTNRQYKAFVDRVATRNVSTGKSIFSRTEEAVSWDEAMARFRDGTGRPGPKDWSQGEYPKGQDDFPVTGISWYEAAAYAEFAGKSLPTIYHWNRAAGPFSAAFIVPASNFGTAGVLPVGSKQDMSPWGNYDMAGNVKEWIWTEAEHGKRYVLGGAWDEPTYMFIDPDAQSPFLRASNIGFRCVKYIEPESIPKQASDPMPSPRRDLTKEKPRRANYFRLIVACIPMTRHR